MGILYADNTNLWVGLEEDNDKLLAATKGHDALMQWDKFLMAVIGEFKPETCAFTVSNMIPDRDGTCKHYDEVKCTAELKLDNLGKDGK